MLRVNKNNTMKLYFNKRKEIDFNVEELSKKAKPSQDCEKADQEKYNEESHE